MATARDDQSSAQTTGGFVASLVNAITKDGYLAAAGRQGAKELANAFGQFWPESILVQEPGGLFSPTQGEIAASRHEELEHERDI